MLEEVTLTQERSEAEQEALRRGAELIAQALQAMEQASSARAEPLRDELSRSSALIEQLSGRLEQQLAEDKEQRGVLAGQLTTLAGSLDALVNHLQSLSHLMADILERLAEPPPAPEPPAEPAFAPGGEGVALTINRVAGFQALMDIQKALMSMDQVAGASVERFQEDGDSRILLQLSAPITASALADDLRRATNHAFAVEESRPELLRLRIKFVPST